MGPRYKKLVTEAKSKVTETSPAEAAKAKARGVAMVDVRGKEEWDEEKSYSWSGGS